MQTLWSLCAPKKHFIKFKDSLLAKKVKASKFSTYRQSYWTCSRAWGRVPLDSSYPACCSWAGHMETRLPSFPGSCWDIQAVWERNSMNLNTLPSIILFWSDFHLPQCDQTESSCARQDCKISAVSLSLSADPSGFHKEFKYKIKLAFKSYFHISPLIKTLANIASEPPVNQNP